mgnify:CR=1 FL=1
MKNDEKSSQVDLIYTDKKITKGNKKAPWLKASKAARQGSMNMLFRIETKLSEDETQDMYLTLAEAQILLQEYVDKCNYEERNELHERFWH